MSSGASPLKKILFIMCMALLCSSCITTSLDKTNSYANQVLYFSYPGNWKIIDDRVSSVSGMIEFKTPERVTVFLHYTPEYSTLETVVRDYYSKFDIVETYNNKVFSIKKSIGKNEVNGYERHYEYSILGDDYYGVKEYYSMHGESSNIYFYIKHDGSREGAFESGLNYLLGTFSFKTP